jgi:hypothetical protein
MMSTKTPKGTSKRRLKLFFNREARKSSAEALKKASWLTVGASAYLGWAKDSVWYLVVVSVSWLVLQSVAHVILSLEETGRNADKDTKNERKNDG